jgi:hypothetical protein
VWVDGSGVHAEDLDGPGTGTAGGRTSDGITQVSSAVVVGSTLHVFYVDSVTGEIRHASYDGTSWTFEAITGTNASDDPQISAVALNGQVHLFFGRRDQATPQPITLRHEWFDGTSWQVEDLDGPGVAGGNGRTSDSVGFSATAFSDGTSVHVFYQGAAGIRHAYFDGSTWSFDVPEAFGLLMPRGAVVVNGAPHVFSYDPHFATVLHDWYQNGSWHDDTIDGVPNGTACAIAGIGQQLSAAVVGGEPSAFFRGNSGQLCTSTWTSTGYKTTQLDGNGSGTADGRTGTLDTVGPAVAVNGTIVHVFYGNGVGSPHPQTGQLRHAFTG